MIQSAIMAASGVIRAIDKVTLSDSLMASMTGR
jgi:hypothetical protein